MADPILDAHEVLPGFYVLSGWVSPTSIRDQILRGKLVIDRLIEQKLIGEDLPLLIIGAGVGGATAAIWAANDSNRVHTTLIDQDSGPFRLQRYADTRHLNPTQYDWPVDHWPYGVFPWSRSHAPLPLPYPTDRGNNLAVIWTNELDKAYNQFSPRLDVSYQTSVTAVPTGASPMRLEVTFTGAKTGTKQFAAIVWAAGSGREECRLLNNPNDPHSDPIYEGRAFWSHDPFSQRDCGVSPATPRVLIAGAGDGGLQDYLRTVTKHDFAEEFYRKCNIPQEIANRIQSAEDRAHRGRIWANEDKAWRETHEKPFMEELQQVHEVAVQDALNAIDVEQSLKQLFPVAPHHTVLVYRKPYFTNYYGLNRFLVLLVAKFLGREFGLVTLRPETTITDVSTAYTDRHTCMVRVGSGEWQPGGGYSNPDCHGREHDVTLRDGKGNFTTEKFNVIIVRYGPREKNAPPLPPPYQNKLPLSRSQHLLPYHLPS